MIQAPDGLTTVLRYLADRITSSVPPTWPIPIFEAEAYLYKYFLRRLLTILDSLVAQSTPWPDIAAMFYMPSRVVEYCAHLARSAPEASIYVGVAGPTDPIALARYAQRCGVSVSLRALKTLGTGIARLVTNSDPKDQLVALARYSLQRQPSNVVGVHIYSFGGAAKTAAWMRDHI